MERASWNLSKETDEAETNSSTEGLDLQGTNFTSYCFKWNWS